MTRRTEVKWTWKRSSYISKFEPLHQKYYGKSQRREYAMPTAMRAASSGGGSATLRYAITVTARYTQEAETGLSCGR
jgi:hypothetical protein